MRLLEFLHCRENDTVSLASDKKLAKVLTAFRLDWFLPEEVLSFAELGVELFVQVVPVGNDYNGRFVKHLLYQMCVEDH